MADRKKVINALGRCESYGYCEDKRCPYYEDTSCLESMRKDALELLKEQEAVTPEEVSMYPQINMLAVAAAMFQSEPKTITQNSARRADGR